MGDRTYCSVRVLQEHRDRVVATLEDENGEPCDETDMDGGRVMLGYQEVNYGDLKGLPQLQKEGIPYDFEWDRGGDYDGGWHHVRFTEDGVLRVIETPSEINAVITVDELSKILNEEPAPLATIKAWVALNTVLPWDNQAEYGRRYLAKKLLEG